MTDQTQTDTTPAEVMPSHDTDALALMAELHGGYLAHELNEKLGALLTAVKDTGNKGHVTIKLLVEPLPKLGDAAIVISHDVDAKLPKPKRRGESRFIGTRNEITKHDPNAPSLPGGDGWGRA